MAELYNFNGWIVERDEPTLKEFYEMSQEAKNNYICYIIDKPEDKRSNIQKHIVRFYNIVPTKEKHFFTLDVEE